MSKIYIVEHDDGRRVYEHGSFGRFYVKTEPCTDPELRLFRTRSRNEAERICKITEELGGWSGFKVKVLKRKRLKEKHEEAK